MMNGDDKLFCIGGLSFISLSILFLVKDPNNVVLSILIPIYYLCSLSALLTVFLVCCCVALELWYSNLRARYLSTNNLYRFLTNGLTFTVLCIAFSWFLCIGSGSLSSADVLSLICCTFAAAISASCQKTEKSIAVVTAVQQQEKTPSSQEKKQQFISADSTDDLDLDKKAVAKSEALLSVELENIKSEPATTVVDPLTTTVSTEETEPLLAKEQSSTTTEATSSRQISSPLVVSSPIHRVDINQLYAVQCQSNIDGLPSKRRRTALELLQTEATYLKNLTIVIQMFKDPLEKAAREDPNALLGQPDIDSAFGGLPVIKELHDEIYQDLKLLIDDWVEDCSIGEIMCKYEDRLIKAYPPYVNYFDIGKELIQKRRKESAELDKFLLDLTMNPNCMQQPLDALLIRPVQRLPSMALLMKDLRKRTPVEIKDHQDLEKAENALKNVLMHVNEDKRRFEQKMKIFDIVYQVDNCPPNLISSDRRFISRLEVITLNDGLYRSGERLDLYLLSDKLEVAKWRRRPSARSPFLLKHIQLLDLEKVETIYDISDTDELKNVYAIKYSGEAYNDTDKTGSTPKISVLESLDSFVFKKKWITAIAEQVCQIRSNIKPHDITSTLEANDLADMVKKGTKLYRRLKSSVRSKNE